MRGERTVRQLTRPAGQLGGAAGQTGDWRLVLASHCYQVKTEQNNKQFLSDLRSQPGLTSGVLRPPPTTCQVVTSQQAQQFYCKQEGNYVVIW